MFKAKEIEAINLEEEKLDRERRFPVAGAEQKGAVKVEQTVKLFLEDLLQIVVSVQEKRSSAWMDGKKIADMKREKCLDRLRMKEKA